MGKARIGIVLENGKIESIEKIDEATPQEISTIVFQLELIKDNIIQNFKKNFRKNV